MSVSTLERISDNIAQGIVENVLTPDETNIKLPAFGPRSTDKLPMNRVGCWGENFRRASDQMAVNPNGAYFYNHRVGRIVFEVVTQKQGDSQVGPDSVHAGAIGRIRWLMSRMAQKLVAANIGGYEVYDVRDQGEQWSRNEETGTDRTRLPFEFEIAIPPSGYTDS